MSSGWILGIAASHNAGMALIRDGRVVVAIQAERLVRRKRQSLSLGGLGTVAAEAIAYCLRYAGIDLPDVEAIATSTPWEAVSPALMLRDQEPQPALPPFVSVPHHLAHAEYALHYSPMRPCLVLVCDGSGTWESQRRHLDIIEEDAGACRFVQQDGKESISAYRFDGRNLRLVYRIAYGAADIDVQSNSGELQRRAGWLASLGHLWEWAALYCHGSAHEAGKVMGLAAFGDPGVHSDLDVIGLEPTGAMRIRFAGLADRFRSPNLHGADISGDSHYADLAAFLQGATNTFLVDLVRFLQERHGRGPICYSGGVALNSIANEHLRRTLGVELHMNGSCEDNGTAIGAALAVDHALHGRRVAEEVTDYHGRAYATAEIDAALQGYPGRIDVMPERALLDFTARQLAGEAVIGWFQGRSEFGPRSLGNRSILADPRSACMQALLNQRVKRREAFRPYAPAVVDDRAAEFFEIEGPSPVMLRVVPVRGARLPAVTHADGTARVQTVSRDQNALFHALLSTFGALTGTPVLLNTSFNIAGEPIVETPADALRTFLNSRMDLLVMGDRVVHPSNREAGQGAVT